MKGSRSTAFRSISRLPETEWVQCICNLWHNYPEPYRERPVPHGGSCRLFNGSFNRSVALPSQIDKETNKEIFR